MTMLEKLVNLLDSSAGKEIIVVSEFDNVLFDGDTFDIFCDAFGDCDFIYELRAKLSAIKALSGDGAAAKASALWAECAGLFRKYNIDPDFFALCENKNLEVNGQAGSLMTYCEKNDIPLYIISTGLGNLILPIIARSGALSGNLRVISNFIRFGDDGYEGYTPAVTPFNRSAHLSLELAEFDNFHALVLERRDEAKKDDADYSILPAGMYTVFET